MTREQIESQYLEALIDANTARQILAFKRFGDAMIEIGFAKAESAVDRGIARALQPLPMELAGDVPTVHEMLGQHQAAAFDLIMGKKPLPYDAVYGTGK